MKSRSNLLAAAALFAVLALAACGGDSAPQPLARAPRRT